MLLRLIATMIPQNFRVGPWLSQRKILNIVLLYFGQTVLSVSFGVLLLLAAGSSWSGGRGAMRG